MFYFTSLYFYTKKVVIFHECFGTRTHNHLVRKWTLIHLDSVRLAFLFCKFWYVIQGWLKMKYSKTNWYEAIDILKNVKKKKTLFKENFQSWYLLLKTHSKFWDNLVTEGPLKMMKRAFYFILKALFVHKMFRFLSLLFDHVEERLD